ncbi:MAG: hypothetical protein AB1567_05805 [bacterium]
MSIVIDVDTRRFAEKGKEIYKELKDKLEPEYKGKLVAIDSGDYFLGNTLREAAAQARAKYSDKVFYVVKIGYPAVYVFR